MCLEIESHNCAFIYLPRLRGCAADGLAYPLMVRLRVAPAARQPEELDRPRLHRMTVEAAH